MFGGGGGGGAGALYYSHFGTSAIISLKVVQVYWEIVGHKTFTCAFPHFFCQMWISGTQNCKLLTSNYF